MTSPSAYALMVATGTIAMVVENYRNGILPETIPNLFLDHLTHLMPQPPAGILLGSGVNEVVGGITYPMLGEVAEKTFQNTDDGRRQFENEVNFRQHLRMFKVTGDAHVFCADRSKLKLLMKRYDADMQQVVSRGRRAGHRLTSLEMLRIARQSAEHLVQLTDKLVALNDWKAENIFISDGIVYYGDLAEATFLFEKLRFIHTTQEFWSPSNYLYMKFIRDYGITYDRAKSEVFAFGCYMMYLYFGRHFFGNGFWKSDLYNDMVQFPIDFDKLFRNRHGNLADELELCVWKIFNKIFVRDDKDRISARELLSLITKAIEELEMEVAPLEQQLRDYLPFNFPRLSEHQCEKVYEIILRGSGPFDTYRRTADVLRFLVEEALSTPDFRDM